MAPLLRHPAHDTLRALYREPELESNSFASPSSGDKPYVAAVTHYVVADLSSEQGRTLVAEVRRGHGGPHGGMVDDRNGTSQHGVCGAPDFG